MPIQGPNVSLMPSRYARNEDAIPFVIHDQRGRDSVDAKSVEQTGLFLPGDFGISRLAY